MALVREIPLFEGIPPSPTTLRHITRRREYGSTAKIPFPNNIAVLLIEFYQHQTENKEHVCNHIPSCSEYARASFLTCGFLSASLLTMERLKQCSDPLSDWPKENRP